MSVPPRGRGRSRRPGPLVPASSVVSRSLAQKSPAGASATTRCPQGNCRARICIFWGGGRKICLILQVKLASHDTATANILVHHFLVFRINETD